MLTDFDREATYYDLFEHRNEEMHRRINAFLIDFLTKKNVRRVIDFSCGTGAQCLPLSRAGFEVTGVDISPKMIECARAKAHDNRVNFVIGDVRKLVEGTFGACIMILNSIGYLQKTEFRDALQNISRNLTEEGYFIFDNTNREALEAGALFSGKFIDTAAEVRSKKIVRFAEAHYDHGTGIARWDWECFVQEGFTPIIRESGSWIRQTYTIAEMETILQEHRMKVVEAYDRNLLAFDPATSFTYLVVAQKVGQT